MQRLEAKSLCKIEIKYEPGIETKESKIVEINQVEVIGDLDDNLLDDISCSIGTGVLKNPAVLPCDHVFERAAILKAVQLYHRCSLCAAAMTEADVTEAKSMNAKLSSAVARCLSTPAGCQKLLSDGLDLVKHLTKDHLNAVCSEGPHSGLPVIYALTAMPSGRKLLKASPHLVSLVTRENLNTVCDRDASPLYWLTATSDGREILRTYPKLLEKITPKGLNTTRESGPERGASPLYWLAASPDGLILLQQNELLVEKITVPGLNTPRTTGPERGKSALYEIARTDDGRQILRSPKNKLLSKITPEGLNTIASHAGPDQGTSVLYWLYFSDSFDFMFWNQGALVKMIDAQTLNSVCKGSHGNNSVLLMIARCVNYLDFIKSPYVVDNITQECLNAVYQKDGSSVLYHITAKDEGLEILKDNPSLVKKISSTGLNAIVHCPCHEGVTPFYNLAASEIGRQLLLDHPDLLMKTTSIGLNTIRKQPGYRGMSALYFILKDPDYRVTLLSYNNGFLAKKVLPEALNAICDDERYPGISAFSWIFDEDESLVLLEQNYGLLEKVSESALNAVITGGEAHGESALLSLVMSERGRNLLLKSPKLITKMNPQGLNAVNQDKDHKGTTALFKLSSYNDTAKLILNDKRIVKMIQPVGLNSTIDDGDSALAQLIGSYAGMDIFLKYPELVEEITEEGLNSIIKYGDEAGSSALYYFLSDDHGIEFFHKYPSLVKKITKVGLNAMIENGDNQGDSALMALVSEPDGLTLLLKNPGLCRLIEVVTLHSLVKKSKDSPYRVLMRSGEGKNVLKLIRGVESTEEKRETMIPLSKSSALGLFAPEEKKIEDLSSFAYGAEKLLEFVKAAAENKIVECLILASNKIDDETAIKIADILMVSKSIISVDLSDNAIGGKGAAAFAKLKNIKTLNLSSNPVTSKGQKALAKNKTLTTLVLSSLTNEGISAFSRDNNVKLQGFEKLLSRRL